MAAYDEQTAKIERFDKRIEELASQERYQEKVKKPVSYTHLDVYKRQVLVASFPANSMVFFPEVVADCLMVFSALSTV